MADNTALPLVLLAEQFAKLPGIGMKSAERLAYHVLTMSESEVNAFSQALLNAHGKIHECRICMNFTDEEICPVCSNMSREHNIICVVESPKDVRAIERTHEYKGVYHVLHGHISPMDGITPDSLRIKQLITRLGSEPAEEVIMATNPTVEGEATAMYISKLIKPLGIKVTRLAFGLPVGATVEYADEVTLFSAIKNRSEI